MLCVHSGKSTVAVLVRAAEGFSEAVNDQVVPDRVAFPDQNQSILRRGTKMAPVESGLYINQVLKVVLVS